MSPLLSVADATLLIREHAPRLGVERIPIVEAAGRVLRQEVVADRDQPPFHRATMDGIAIDSRHAARHRRVVGLQPAGQPSKQLGSPENAVEIMTGAPMPSDADCVVPVEQIDLNEGVATLHPDAVLAPWKFVHREGTDYPAGSRLLESGVMVGPAEVAVLASVGCARVAVGAWPAVTVISTGDELRAVDEPVESFQIRRANDYAICAALKARGLSACRNIHIRDDVDALKSGVESALSAGHWLIITGGVSKGRFDHLPDVLAALGVIRHFHRIAQKPGKPMWFGTRDASAVFALPGNPVSALVCLHRYVLPALDHAAGGKVIDKRMVLDCDVAPKGNLTHFLPIAARTDDSGRLYVEPCELNTSGDFFGLSGTLGVVELDAAESHYTAGAPLPFYPWQI